MGFMTGNGNIARLPRAIRDELNRRVDDGQTGKEILPWLNGLPEVKNCWPNRSPDGPSANKTSPNGRPACRAVASWRRRVAIAFGWPGAKRSPRPADDGHFRQGLNHENYQTNPFRVSSHLQHNAL